MKRLSALIISLVLAAGIIMPAATALAWNPFTNACSQTSDTAACGVKTSNPISGSGGVVNKTARIIAVISGMTAIIMLVIAGFQYVTSNGDSGKINSAKNTVIYTIVGLAIVLMAGSLVYFIINKFG